MDDKIGVNVLHSRQEVAGTDEKKRLQRGEAFEKIAFSLCKIALFCLLTQKFALPFAALGSALFFSAAMWHGKSDTKCWAKHPALIAMFWFAVAAVWVLVHLH